MEHIVTAYGLSKETVTSKRTLYKKKYGEVDFFDIVSGVQEGDI